MNNRIFRAGLALAVLLFGLRPLARAYDSYSSLDVSSVVSVSSSMVTGATQVLTGTNFSGGWVALYAPATAGVTGEQVAIGSSTSVSTNTTSGSFRFPVGAVFTLYDYKGPLYAIAVGTSPLNLSVVRKR